MNEGIRIFDAGYDDRYVEFYKRVLKNTPNNKEVARLEFSIGYDDKGEEHNIFIAYDKNNKRFTCFTFYDEMYKIVKEFVNNDEVERMSLRNFTFDAQWCENNFMDFPIEEFYKQVGLYKDMNKGFY